MIFRQFFPYYFNVFNLNIEKDIDSQSFATHILKWFFLLLESIILTERIKKCELLRKITKIISVGKYHEFVTNIWSQVPLDNLIICDDIFQFVHLCYGTKLIFSIKKIQWSFLCFPYPINETREFLATRQKRVCWFLLTSIVFARLHNRFTGSRHSIPGKSIKLQKYQEWRCSIILKQSNPALLMN